VERLNRAIEYLQNRMQQYKEELQRGGDPEATLHALADEILKHRRALRLLARAIG
jgi:prefoldin subunit 5